MSNEQESTSTNPNSLENCVAILVDVAGTTTSINFVQETLFPFVKEQVGEFLKTNWDKDEIKDAIKLLKKPKEDDDKTEATVPSLDEAIELIKTLTDKQDSNSGLKTIQGLIYKSGYENGNLKGHVFDDVQPSFESWSKIGKKIAIYSTGSIDSQKLLFSHTINGDLTEFITKYYDQTVIGLKTDCESYQKIAKDLEIKPNETVFISDNLNEVKAAKSAGFNVFLIHRDSNETIPEADRKDFTTISSFKEVNIETTIKRKIEENETATEEEPPTKISKTEIVEKTDNNTVDDDNKNDEIKEDKDEEMITEEIKEQKAEKASTETTITDDEKTVDEENKCDKKETEEVVKNSDKKDESSTAPIKENNDEEKHAKNNEKEKESIETNAPTTTITTTKENNQTTAKETTDTNETVEESDNNETTTATKTEEKENKNVLANGVENNGDNNMEVVEEQSDAVAEVSKNNDNDNTETKETGDDKDAATTTTTSKTTEKEAETTKTDEDTENTVKKLEETTKSPAAVSVEV